MKRRQHKRLRDAANLAGALHPWRSMADLISRDRMLRNRRRERREPEPKMEYGIGRVDGFRFIASPLL